MGEGLSEESGGVREEEGVVRVEDGAVERVDGGETRGGGAFLSVDCVQTCGSSLSLSHTSSCPQSMSC